MLETISYQTMLGFPILTWIVFLPTVGALLLLFFKPTHVKLIRSFTLAVTILDFLAIILVVRFESGVSHMQFVEHVDWIPSIGASYHLGVDGISVLLVFLTTLIGAVAILSTWQAITSKVKEFMIAILFLQTAMLGVFVSLDVLLFYLFWEAMLPPMYLIIGVWGSDRRIYSAFKFFIYTMAGSLPMVLGLLALYFNYHTYAVAHNLPQLYSFNLLDFYAVPLPVHTQMWVFWVLFIGFAVKVPMFPFHTWLPDAHTNAPTAGSVILAGVLLKMGSYGFVRLSLPLLPAAVVKYMPVMLALSAAAILYGAWVAMNQDDMKKLVAYSSVSHMGYITLGIFVLQPTAVSGAVLQMINHGLSTGALFLLIGLIYDRRHTRLISEYGGLHKVIPVYTAFFALMMLSSMGVPGLNNFVGEIQILIGTYKANHFYFVIAVVGILATAAYLLWLFQRVVLGEVTNPANKGLKDLSFREVATLLPIAIMVFWIGFYPTPFIKIIRPSTDWIVNQYTNNQASLKKPVQLAHSQIKKNEVDQNNQGMGR